MRELAYKKCKNLYRYAQRICQIYVILFFRACYLATKADLKARAYIHNFRQYFRCGQWLDLSNSMCLFFLSLGFCLVCLEGVETFVG